MKSIELLSKRENEVVKAVLKGYSNKQIAEELEISPNTVKTHLQHVFHKMKVSSKTELILKFYAPSEG